MVSLKGNIASFTLVNRTTSEPEDRLVYINMDSIDGWYQVVSDVMDICVKNCTFRVVGWADDFANNYYSYMNAHKNIR